jgi:hypothetical protein
VVIDILIEYQSMLVWDHSEFTKLPIKMCHGLRHWWCALKTSCASMTLTIGPIVLLDLYGINTKLIAWCISCIWWVCVDGDANFTLIWCRLCTLFQWVVCWWVAELVLQSYWGIGGSISVQMCGVLWIACCGVLWSGLVCCVKFSG